MRQAFWEKRAELIRPFDGSGKTAAEIAAQIGISPITVSRYAKRYGFDIARCAHVSDIRKNEMEERIQAVRECSERGLSRKETADLLNITENTISRYCMEFGVYFPHGRQGYCGDLPRAEAMASMYASGKTLQEIGEFYKVTRERVRQIISKHHGMNRESGGKSIRADRRREAKSRKREDRTMKKYGCSHGKYRELVELGRQMIADGATRERTPTGAWHSQRSNARSRGIEWNITLWDWWELWQRSGKWDIRGRTKGSYVMCRFGDTGAYEIGNVYIATCSHNCSVQPNHPMRQSSNQQVAA